MGCWYCPAGCPRQNRQPNNPLIVQPNNRYARVPGSASGRHQNDRSAPAQRPCVISDAMVRPRAMNIRPPSGVMRTLSGFAAPKTSEGGRIRASAGSNDVDDVDGNKLARERFRRTHQRRGPDPGPAPRDPGPAPHERRVRTAHRSACATIVILHRRPQGRPSSASPHTPTPPPTASRAVGFDESRRG